MIRYLVLSYNETKELSIPGFEDEHPAQWDYSRSFVVRNENDNYKIIGYDGGEPEDQTLYRDWNWVAIELNQAFIDGFDLGQKS